MVSCCKELGVGVERPEGEIPSSLVTSPGASDQSFLEPPLPVFSWRRGKRSQEKYFEDGGKYHVTTLGVKRVTCDVQLIMFKNLPLPF